MFNVGGGEILVILLVALIVLGPQRLPGAVRQAGQFMGELRKMSAGFQRELQGALDDAEQPAPRRAPRDAQGEPRAELPPAEAGNPDDPSEGPRA